MTRYIPTEEDMREVLRDILNDLGEDCSIVDKMNRQQLLATKNYYDVCDLIDYIDNLRSCIK